MRSGQESPAVEGDIVSFVCDHPDLYLHLIRPSRRPQTMSSYPPGGDYDERLLDTAPKATKAERQVRPFPLSLP